MTQDVYMGRRAKNPGAAAALDSALNRGPESRPEGSGRKSSSARPAKRVTCSFGAPSGTRTPNPLTIRRGRVWLPVGARKGVLTSTNVSSLASTLPVTSPWFSTKVGGLVGRLQAFQEGGLMYRVGHSRPALLPAILDSHTAPVPSG